RVASARAACWAPAAGAARVGGRGGGRGGGAGRAAGGWRRRGGPGPPRAPRPRGPAAPPAAAGPRAPAARGGTPRPTRRAWPRTQERRRHLAAQPRLARSARYAALWVRILTFCRGRCLAFLLDRWLGAVTLCCFFTVREAVAP